MNHFKDSDPPKNCPSLMKINESFLTPLRGNNLIKSHTPSTPYSQTPTQDPMIETPNGSKIFHPFLSNIIYRLDKSFMSPNSFTLKENITKDDSILSPDLAGELFPGEIDIDADTQYQFEADLFKKYKNYCIKKSDLFFKKGTIAPSPDASDSGLEMSLQTSNPSFAEPVHTSMTAMPLLVHKTPPSQYKWNREEYRASSPSLDFTYNVFGDNDESDDPTGHKCNLESTKIFDTCLGLESNVSMRNHSIIVSPTFNDDFSRDYDDENSDMDTESGFDQLRSSPSWKFSVGNIMEDLAMSPICGNLDVKKRTKKNYRCGDDEDFGC